MNLFQQLLAPAFLFSVVRMAVPILYPALGAVVTNKAGVPNIGLEGTMLAASLGGVIGSALSGNAWIGLLVAILTGVAMSCILGYFTLKLKTDVILGGIALNLFASSATVFVLFLLTGDKGQSSSLPSKVLPNIHIPLIQDIPYLGKVLSGHNVLVYIAILAVIVLSFILKKTQLGVHIKAVGENEKAAASVGINVDKVRFISFIISGILCGLGGAFLSMGYVSWFTRDMTAGRGWIALAAEAMGRGTVIGTVLSTLLFAVASALTNVLGLFGVPTELVGTLPYVAAVIALVVYSFINRKKKKVA